MNRRCLLLAVTLLPPPVLGSCDFCVSGIASEREGETIPLSEGRTCAEVSSLAAALDSASPDFAATCPQLLLAELFCCPSGPSAVPEEGGGILEDLLGGEGGGFGEIGGGLFGDGGLGGEGEGILEDLFGGEDGGFGGNDGNSTGDDLFGDFFGSGGTETPCAACPEGLPEGAIDMIVSIEGENGTCADWINNGQLIPFEDGTDFCNLMKAPIESVCCPEQIKELADPCIICPNGITEGFDESTCGELESTASMVSAGGLMCDSYKLSASACCPADDSSGSWFGETIEVTNPCTPCPNGAANESALVLYPGEEEEYALTCAGQLSQVSFVEEESDVCMYMRAIVQQSCCPEEANPCTICPGGVSDSAVIPGDEEEGETLCSEVVESLIFLDANSEACEMTKGFGAEAFCCPDDVQLANPCSICPNGITAVEGGDFIIGEDSEPISGAYLEPMSCDLAVTLSNALEKESEMCSALSMTQLFCCPDDAKTAVDPCPFCPGGISADASAIIPDAGLSCGMGIAYAKMVEKSDEICSDVQMAQSICCPDDFQGAPGETDTAVEEADASITGGSAEASTGEATDAPSETDSTVEEADATSTGDSAEASTGEATDASSGTDSTVEEADAASTGDSAEASTGDAAEEIATADPTEEPEIDPVDDEQPSVEPPTGSAFGRTQLLGSCVMAVSIAYLL